MYCNFKNLLREQSKKKKAKWVPWDWFQAAVNTTGILLEHEM